MLLKFSYGSGYQEFVLNKNNLLQALSANPLPPGRPELEEVAYALENPIGTPRLREIVQPGEKVAIITSDITRPMPTSKVLPLIIAELKAGGVALADVQVVLARGIHRAHTLQEQRSLIGAGLFEQLKVVDSNPQDVVRLGCTRQGTPVDIFRPVAVAERRICLGNIEFHYFAGYSGGAKAIMPGVSTRAAIQRNHRFMTDPRSRAGELEANPVRQDLEEAIGLAPIDFILNVVLDERKKIVKAVAGHFQQAHREGCRYLDRLYKVGITALADIVLVTPGGHPKDLNLYQSQKALANAQHAVRPGGIIILAAECGEGLGEKVFEQWMLSASHPVHLVEKIQQNFELGGHKAAAIAMVLGKARVFLVSEIEPVLVRRLFMEPFPTIDAALARAQQELGEEARLILMPAGGSTLPVLISQSGLIPKV